jgi:hypothetical protein
VKASALLLAAAFLAGRPKVEVVAPEAPTDVPVARLISSGAHVEVLRDGKWTTASDGRVMRTGERLRTGSDIAILRFPWLRLLAGPETTFSILPSLVLSASLDSGRVEQSTKDEDIIKIVTSEAIVRGSGRVVVRRQADRTFVSALDGAFDVANGLGTVHLGAGEGTVVEKGHRGTPPASLPQLTGAPTAGTDPRYVREREPIVLRWDSSAARHHLQVLAFDSDDVAFAGDVDGTEMTLRLPLGLFRWHVAVLDGERPEGRPSADGYLCVVAD